jgi:hypothetical protein
MIVTEVLRLDSDVVAHGVVMPFASSILDRAITEHLVAVGNSGLKSRSCSRLRRRWPMRFWPGNRILRFGNGGSAADAQHLAAELVGRCRRERRSVASMSFTDLDGGTIGRIADAAVCIAPRDTSRVQESHTQCRHRVFDWLETCWCNNRQSVERDLDPA